MQRKKELKEELEILISEDEFLNNKGFNFDKTKYRRNKFYYSRYRNYEKSIEELNKKIRDNLNEKINILIAIHGFNILKL